MKKNSIGKGRGKGRGGSRVCPECGDPFRRSSNTVCPRCREKLTGVCRECGEPLPRTRTYCSRTCSVKKFHTDVEHQKAAGKAAAASLQKNPRPVRRDVYKKTRGDGRNQHVHIMVAEKVLGRSMKKGEVVHHEDQDKWNNHPDNLIVFPSQADHARHHKLNHCGSPCECPGIRLKEVMPHESPE